MVLFDIALVGLLAGVPSTGYYLVALFMLQMVAVTRKLVVTWTSGSGGRRFFVLFLQALFDIFGDALASNALTPLTEVRP